MEFRLVYEGPLKAATSREPRTDNQQEVRRALHPQLSHLWTRNPELVSLTTHPPGWIDHLGNTFAKCGYRFVPLVSNALELVCHLDILFLRRENPGELVRHGGDLDARLKTLFDALRIPSTCEGLKEPGENENPFFCLLEDDALITGLQITTDRLLTAPSGRETDVSLVIHVRVKATRVTIANMALLT